jgi:hypothetical protein
MGSTDYRNTGRYYQQVCICLYELPHLSLFLANDRRSLQRPDFITERPPEEFLLANLTQEADITRLLFMCEDLFLLIRC